MKMSVSIYIYNDTAECIIERKLNIINKNSKNVTTVNKTVRLLMNQYNLKSLQNICLTLIFITAVEHESQLHL